LKKTRSRFAADSAIEKLVSGLTCEQLNLTDLSELEVDGRNYYQIKDLDDGNYMAIVRKGQVFGLMHDPYKIDLLNKSVKDFVAEVNDGKFDFDKPWVRK
jgi:hypothetical protein